MNIVGMGVDLVEIPRFARSMQRWGEPFLKRLFTEDELAYAASKKQGVQHLAVRFAAKEAIVKALGAPKGLGLRWVDVEVLPGEAGQPQVTLKETMAQWAHLKIQLSLTHTKGHAMATALALEIV